MRKLTVFALLAIAVGAIMHFWPHGDPQDVVPMASQSPPRSGSAEVRGDAAAPLQRPSPSPALSAPPASPQAPLAPASATAARFVLHAPPVVRSGDNLSVTIDVQALRAMRHLEFAVTYKKSILRLLGSVPGVFAQQTGMSVQFEESSEGHLLVRVDLEGGTVGAGSIALLEFQALRRGVSPLAVEDVSYVELGGQRPATTPESFQASVLVE